MVRTRKILQFKLISETSQILSNVKQFCFMVMYVPESVHYSSLPIVVDDGDHGKDGNLKIVYVICI
jgi:hypothetical protein